MHDGAAVEALRALVRVPTVSTEAVSADEAEAIARFQEELWRRFPRVAALERESFSGTLLIRWPGREPGEPVVLMAHQDVVAAPPEGWAHPPFSGALAGGRVHGRGTLDDKGSLVALCVAVEALLEGGHAPRHDVLLLLGHDEETRGTGAAAAVAALRERGVRARWVLDEGGAVIEPPVPGVRRDVAVVGVAEKGIATVRLRAAQVGGHASTPPREPATDALAAAVRRVHRIRFPRSLPEPALEMLEALGAHADGAMGRVLRSARRMRPLVERVLARGDETRAMLATTAVVTQLSGSAAANALPEEATAAINVRVAPGDSLAGALARIRRAVGPRVEASLAHGSEPSPVSPRSGEGWEAVTGAIARAWPEVVAVPYVMLGAADARHAHAISDAVYRFAPFAMSRAERQTLHARDESIAVDVWLAGCRWYRDLIETSC